MTREAAAINCWWRCCLVLAMLLATQEASLAVSFSIKPSVLDTTVLPGRNYAFRVEVANGDTQNPLALLLRANILAQGAGGGWIPLDPEAPQAATWLARSCHNWVSISANRIEMPAQGTAEFSVTVRVPPRVRGSYAAAIIAREDRPGASTGVSFIVQALVPLTVSVQGQPASQQYELRDVRLMGIDASPERPATTAPVVVVANTGETRDNVSARVRISRPVGDEWQPALTADLTTVKMLPGSVVNLAADLRRTLPPGRYRMETDLRVQGRAVGHDDRVIEFAGDPNAPEVPVDVSLEVQPRVVEIEGVPDSRRSTSIEIRNAGESSVIVTPEFELPPAFGGKVMGELHGEELSCHTWVEVHPDKLELRPGQKRVLRIVVDTPASELPYHYGILRLVAKHASGDSAGAMPVLVVVNNPKLAAKTAVEVASVELAEEHPNSYVVGCVFTNIGGVHLQPSIEAVLTNLLGGELQRSPLTREATGAVLPLETTQASGALDFSGLKPGSYRLVVNVRENDALFSKSVTVEVTTDPNGVRNVQVAPE